MRQWTRRAVWCVCSASLLAGCAEQKMDMSAMKPPARPAQLDKLEGFAGNWTSSAEMCMGGKNMKMTGSSTIAWDCDKRVLVERATNEMEGMGKSSEMVIYSWDSDKCEYMVAYFSSMGEGNVGYMKWDEKKGAFMMRGKGKNPMTHQTTIFEMEMRMPDNNTMTFSWSEWDGLHMKKMGEGKGTAKRA